MKRKSSNDNSKLEESSVLGSKKNKKKPKSTTVTKQKIDKEAKQWHHKPQKRQQKQAKRQTKKKQIIQQPPFHLHNNNNYDGKSSKKNFPFVEGFTSVVNLLKGRKNVIVLTGAGISVSCGIPDFRSKGSGLYSTLDVEELGLSCPEELFDWEVFQEDPRPFFKFARNLYFPLGVPEESSAEQQEPKRVQPSDAHKLLALLEKKKMLLRVYTQNIDGLEETAGVSSKRIIYAHGSLNYATCCKCKRKVSSKQIEPAIIQRIVPRCQVPKIRGNRNSIAKKTSPSASPTSSPPQPTSPSPKTTSAAAGADSPCVRSVRKRLHCSIVRDKEEPSVLLQNSASASAEVCGGVLKPGVTFFGEALHDNVRKSLEADRKKVDAIIVMGTSLSVAPMSKVIEYLPTNIPRILINRTVVIPTTPSVTIPTTVQNNDDDDESDQDDFRKGYMFDAYLLGYCDDVTRLLAKHLFSPSIPPASLSVSLTSFSKNDNTKTHSAIPEAFELDEYAFGTILATAINSHKDEDGNDDTDQEDEKYHNKDADDHHRTTYNNNWRAFVKKWKCTSSIPTERVFLLPGAQAHQNALYYNGGDNDDGEIDDANSAVTFREIAHCDACSKRIVGIIQKCITCFDYDLCQDCFPSVSKTHFDGKHCFCPELAAPVE